VGWSLALLGAVATAPIALAAQAPAPLGSIRGIVYDSLLARAPLGGAVVELLELGRQVTTDGRGVFRFDSVPGGRYTISFTHPTLTEIGFVPPDRSVTLGAGIDIAYSLGTPTDVSLYRRLCPGPREPDTGVLLGTLTRAGTKVPLVGAEVQGDWVVATVDRSLGVTRRPLTVRAVTDSSGRYQLCGIPSDVAVVVTATAGTVKGEPLEVDTRGRAFGIRNLSLDLGGAASATTVARGTVVDSAGRGVAGAQVLVLGTERTTRTGPDGSFLLSGLRPGSATLEARAIGYTRRRQPIELAPAGTPPVRLVLGRLAVDLPEVKVTARAGSLGSTGFEERRGRANGYFVGRAEIQRRGIVRTEDIFKTVPGLKVETIGGTDYQILSLRGAGFSATCVPAIYIDRTLVPLDPETTGGSLPLTPEEIHGIEVYRAPADAPPEYQRPGTAACGIILIWTRRGAR
jgi:hypothetical protein